MADTLHDTPAQDERLKFKASDVRAMIQQGILDADGHYEVIDGEIWVMQAHNPPHMRVKRWVLRELTLQIGRRHWIDSDPSFYIEEDGDFTLPDIIVYPGDAEPHLVRGEDALLVVEVAVSSLKRDLVLKRALYARHGVRDYWVIDADKRVTHVHRQPVDGDYREVIQVAPTETLEPAYVEGVTLRLNDIG
jgi:Uma2 family endonuclease